MASRNGWRLLPFGHGSRIDWGGLPVAIDLGISTTRLDRLIDHAAGDLTVTAEAGMGFADLQAKLALAGQFLALDPAYPGTATLGGMLATADAGSLRQRYGGVRDMCLGITFVRADGILAKAGGRVVKNVAGYDLMKLFGGSHGTLGIVAELTFRLQPIPPGFQTVILSGSPQGVSELAAQVRGSSLTPVQSDLLSARIARDLGIDGQIALAVRFASIPESIEEQVGILVAKKGAGGVNVLEGQTEVNFWEEVRTQFWQAEADEAVVGKFGVLPGQAVNVLIEADQLGAAAWIHSGSGIGVIRWPKTDLAAIEQFRVICRRWSGYLSVLEAPLQTKEQIDIWGYEGNASGLMAGLKRQFDPQGILAPGRFVGG